jgi:RNA polymerase sigma factor (sigma-70 family)
MIRAVPELQHRPLTSALGSGQRRPLDYEALFLSHLPAIERIVAIGCRRHRLRPGDDEDAASFIKLRLIENDYAILRRFEGRSSLPTYLTMVIQRLFVDYQVNRWGRWRPSTEARRRGPLAVHLERLLYRDRLGLEEALEVLRTDFQVPETADELRELARALPQRVDRRMSPDPSALTGAIEWSAEDGVVRLEARAEAERLEAALERALNALSPQDRLVFKLHYVESISVADISRQLHLDQSRLYRKIGQGQKSIRQQLEAEGIRNDDVRRFLDNRE